MKERGRPVSMESTARLVSEQMDLALKNGAGFPVIDGGPRQRRVRTVPNPNRGPVRRLTDSLLHFLGYRRCGETFADRDRD